VADPAVAAIAPGFLEALPEDIRGEVIEGQRRAS
jgi:hypothetical protein